MVFFLICTFVLFVVFYCVFVKISNNKIMNFSSNISKSMIAAGISIITSSFSFTKQIVSMLVALFTNFELQSGTDIIGIVCGFILIIFGFVYGKEIKDRVFVINLFGPFSQLEISDLKHINDLKLTDYKVKETIIDFVDIFQLEKISEERNQMIVKKIENQCNKFKERSTDFSSGFTSMAPIPYSILAGTYLSGGSVKRFFEYEGRKGKYYELSKGKNKSKKFQKLTVEYPNAININATDLVIAVSITSLIKDGDLEQFDYDVLKIKLDSPRDNVITTMNQLNDYCDLIVTEIENVKEKYPQIETVHMVASIPSCVSEKLGEQFMIHNNRLPMIISYHFVNGNNPKYPFGIVVTDNPLGKRGKLVLSDQGGM